jgi:hypothetical protein
MLYLNDRHKLSHFLGRWGSHELFHLGWPRLWSSWSHIAGMAGVCCRTWLACFLKHCLQWGGGGRIKIVKWSYIKMRKNYSVRTLRDFFSVSSHILLKLQTISNLRKNKILRQKRTIINYIKSLLTSITFYSW